VVLQSYQEDVITMLALVKSISTLPSPKLTLVQFRLAGSVKVQNLEFKNKQ
jgi:hypothetical protein